MSLLTCLVACAALGQPGGGGGGPPPAAVRVDAARSEVVEEWRVVTCELLAVRRSNVASEQAGLVTEFDLEEGDVVESGAVLARLHDARARLEVERAAREVESREADLEERRAQQALASAELARFEEAALASSVGGMELDQRRTSVRSAEARVRAGEADLAWAAAELDLARERLAEMTIRAPFAGVVVSKRTELGEWLSAGSPVVELADVSRIDARLDVPDALVERLASQDARARVRVRATGRVVEAPVAGIVPAADPLSRLTPVRLRLENEGGALRPGMSVVGLVPSGVQGEHLTIHKDALRRDDAGEFVYFDRGGVSAVARVETLFAVADRVAVRAPGLAPGSAVVIEGNERLFPGQPLIVLNAPTGAEGE